MKPYIIFITGLFLLIALSALAQEKKLTLQDAVHLAIDKNRDLQVSRLEINKSAHKVREAKGYALPTVAASGQYLHFLQRQVTFLPGNFAGLADNQIATLRVGGTDAYVGGISLVQPVFQGEIFSGIRAAKLAESLSEEDLAFTQAIVVTEVKKAYLQALITNEQLKLQQQSIARNEQELKDSRSLLAQGRASRVDTLRAYITIENLRPDIIRLTNGVEIAKTVLKTTIGLPESEAIELTDSLSYDSTLPAILSATAWEEAVTARPEVTRLVITEKLNTEQIKLESASYLPRISAIGLAQTQTQANDFRFGDYKWPVSSYVGLQLSVPIFSGFRTAARIQQAKVSRLQSSTQLENTRELIRAEVKIALSRVEESRRRIESQGQTVSTAELSYRITRDRWKQGIASRLDLSDAELSLSQAKSNYLQAVYDYLTATVDLDKALGRIR
ncbi:TolC family protein [Rhodocytophaga rosea]|uniref:TolC family protein n=1 Tax=Rhodocytophaga rosea TaxID=2704465 RepID=A0A6C0GPJ0_9BACT|nr:TolC family protein [Rhodocytophaga rosea]QHT69966.1 TolC family protein [Rhodocytophaga rosea]